MIILGLLAISYDGHLSDGAWAKPYLNELASVLLVSGVLSLLYKIFYEHDNQIRLQKLFRIHDSIEKIGLRSITSETQGFNFTDLIENSDSLSVVINDGLRWIGNYTTSLQHRLSKKGSRTEIFTVDPDGPFLSALANKIDMKEDNLRQKITDSWNRLREIHQKAGKKGDLKIYRLKNYPTHSLFLFDQNLIITPYQICSGRTNVPVYEYAKGKDDTFYFFALHDIENLRAESKIEYDGKNS